MRVRTYVLELAVVGVILVTVSISTGARTVEFLGTCAVLFTFCYVQVASRLDEAMDACQDVEGKAHEVHCRAWLNRYLYLKESCWLLYFVFLGAWSALVGVVIFLLYPYWRRHHLWRRRRRGEQQGVAPETSSHQEF